MQGSLKLTRSGQVNRTIVSTMDQLRLWRFIRMGTPVADIAEALHRPESHIRQPIQYLFDHLRSVYAQELDLSGAACLLCVDELTGLRTRRHGMQLLSKALDEALKTRQELTIVFLDIDGLKSINDRHGHQAGDKILCSAVDLWNRHFHTVGGELFRWGGDEFLVVMAYVSKESAQAMVTRMQHSASTAFSAGVATWNERETLAQFLERADAAMYHDKRRVRGGESSESASRWG